MAAPINSDLNTFGLPPLNECIYTLCYCEENIWKLCEYISKHCTSYIDSCYAVFISNKLKAIPLWCQKSQTNTDVPVLWDYHVIFLHQDGYHGVCSVYDLDTSLPFPCTLDEYLTKSIRPEHCLKPEYCRFFRVITAKEFLEHFASNRRHMLSEDGSWLHEPPSYPPIKTQGSDNNIEEFISMDPEKGGGAVISLDNFARRFLQDVHYRNFSGGSNT